MKNNENEVAEKLGFEGATFDSKYRLINKNGSSNIKRQGLNAFASYNFYHSLVTMSWFSFFLIILFYFVAVNSLFATIFYFIIGDNVGIVNSQGDYNNWLKMFFLSVQTITAGQTQTSSWLANTISSILALIGLLTFAVITGVLYGRFAKPTAKLIYSKNILIMPYKGITALSMRAANAKISQLIEIEAKLIISLLINKNSHIKERVFYNVEIENNKVALLATVLNLIHIIDKDSPIYNFTDEELREHDAEFILMITAIDDTYAQQVNTRTSYKWYDIVRGNRFAPIVKLNEREKMTFKLKEVGLIETKS